MKIENFDLYTIDINYIKYLYNFDSQVYYNENNSRYHNKPYIGIVTKIDKYNYFIPLTSAKPNHLQLKNNGTYHMLIQEQLKRKQIKENNDIFKVIKLDLDNPNNDIVKKIYSLINFKKSIPVPEGCFDRLIINGHKDEDLLRIEFNFV